MVNSNLIDSNIMSLGKGGRQLSFWVCSWHEKSRRYLRLGLFMESVSSCRDAGWPARGSKCSLTTSTPWVRGRGRGRGRGGCERLPVRSGFLLPDVRVTIPQDGSSHLFDFLKQISPVSSTCKAEFDLRPSLGKADTSLLETYHRTF
jgi:hypothetical protein